MMIHQDYPTLLDLDHHYRHKNPHHRHNYNDNDHCNDTDEDSTGEPEHLLRELPRSKTTDRFSSLSSLSLDLFESGNTMVSEDERRKDVLEEQREGMDVLGTDEDEMDGDKVPGLDSPGRTSELSSSMCSTPMGVVSGLPVIHNGRPFFPLSSGFTSTTATSSSMNTTTPTLDRPDSLPLPSLGTASPLSISPPKCMSENKQRKGLVLPTPLVIDYQGREVCLESDSESEEEDARVHGTSSASASASASASDPRRWSPKHRSFGEGKAFRSCLIRTVSSPAVEKSSPSKLIKGEENDSLAGQDGLVPPKVPRLHTSLSEQETTPTRSSLLSLGHCAGHRDRAKRNVSFCTKSPREFPVHTVGDYDRSPHPVVPRLSYRDVLELREMKVEMTLVTRRQQGSAGLGGEKKVSAPVQKKNEPEMKKVVQPMRSELDRDQQYQHQYRPQPRSTRDTTNPSFTLLENDEASDHFPPSPSALTSSFPSSVKLVSRLNEMGDFKPPMRERGMGLKVEPSLGLDRVGSGDSLRDEFAKHMETPTSATLRRKTSGDFAVVESEFAKELRMAREELEAIAVQEARLGLAYQLGGTKSNKGEQHSVAMGSSGSSTPSGLGIRPSPSLTSGGMRTASQSSLNPGGRTRTNSGGSSVLGLGQRQVEPNMVGTSFVPSPLPDRDLAPFTRKDGILSRSEKMVEQSEEGSILFPTKPITTYKPPTNIYVSASNNNNPAVSSRNTYRPPSPIMAPFARSAPIRATAPRSSRPSAAGPGSSGGFFRPPSPILAPFARSGA